MVGVGSIVIIETIGGGPGSRHCHLECSRCHVILALVHRYGGLVGVGGGEFPSRHCRIRC